MKTEYGFLFVFPEEGGIEANILESNVIEVDGEEIVVHQESKGIVPLEDADATLEAFRREALS